MRYIGVLLLTGMLVLGIGLRGLPAPCQNGHCGTGGCATSAHPCPPSCTCHWSHDADGDCCHPDGHAHAGHHEPALLAAHAHHDPGAADHDHGPAAQAHDPATVPAGHPAHHHQAGHHIDRAAAGPSSHCAPDHPGTDDSWPHLSLPHVQPPAALAVGVALDVSAIPDQVSTALPAVCAWAHPPPQRPPAA